MATHIDVSTEAHIDVSGKRRRWEGTCVIPVELPVGSRRKPHSAEPPVLLAVVSAI